ncbi:unnamed protein product [Echinostoma caproni]|uniref:PDZ domain-containing protein n=1 Tax=Echinostoma caproni TaxID=27848 RepID=A0A183AZY9_9TREM|nr:unnamed protein product [Echinostoma caproni]
MLLIQASITEIKYVLLLCPYWSSTPNSGSNGLGFSLTSRDLNPNSNTASVTERVVCVKTILPGGAALLDGRLRSGDRLVQVDLSSMTSF